MTHTAAMFTASHLVAPQTRPLARNRDDSYSTDIKVFSIYSVLHFADILVSTGYEPAHFQCNGIKKRPKPPYGTYGTYDGHGVASSAAPTHRRRNADSRLFGNVGDRPPLAEPQWIQPD